MSKYDFIKLNKLCSKITDGSHYSPVGIETGVPMLSVKDMLNNSFNYNNSKYISEDDYKELAKGDCKPLKNDLVIAKDGSFLKYIFVIKKEIKQAVLSSIGILRPDLSKVIPEYLKYYLQTQSVKETVSKKYVSGSALPRIILKNFGEIDVIYKPLKEQKKIAKVLSDLDAKIELNNKINAELEAMAKLIYDYWFVQFDFPFDFAQGKPSANGKPYKSSGGKMVYNEVLKREIPEGWEVKRLKNFAETSSGGTPLKSKKEYYEGGNIPWINSGEINEPFIIKAEKFITEEGLNNSAAKIFKMGTILMAMYGATAGKVSLIDVEACTNQAICAINPNNKFYNLYIKYGLENLYEYLVSLSSGSARDNLSQDKIKEIILIDPQIEILQKFHDKTYPLIKMIFKKMNENQKLTELRDWLLPMLMNGQVTVTEAEEKVTASMEGAAG